ncbi:MAG TPA: malto-oligosyltrehalose trehalohydrolase [Pyrinomonadaceae bacterium]|jgi:maltooligosyltrehalose trehalohydrolase|nr:malto-oligosyltrehalose trehalohydrolase [Pyrinomonadaceae bacterium]
MTEVLSAVGAAAVRELKESERGWRLELGARPQADGSTVFRVWAPLAESVAVKILGDEPQTVSMERGEDDVFELRLPDTPAGTDYFYLVGGERERPDPVSRFQPAGVHGPSRVVDPEAFAWTDEGWRGLPLKDYVIYELHVGTFTPEGTFDAAIEKLPYLRELGVTAVEIMPVAEFPGGRNWGYDGAHLYAPQSTYGGPDALKRLVDACHREGLAFVLDVVYNHLGPEGNYLGEYMPVFSGSYKTPWGDALNFDGEESDGVRRHFVSNALYWLNEFHVDALRLDAVHRIFDQSPRHLLEEIATEFREGARRLGRLGHTIAESDLNDVRLLRPTEVGGYGLDAQWSDDFHHSLHALLTKTERGYFADFGRVADLAKAIEEGFVYDGRRSRFRRRRHGTPSLDVPGEQLVVCVQNHDQIANGYWGDRLSRLLNPRQQMLAAAVLLAGAPNVPMLFMGQEWSARAPFLYFTSHTDKGLGQAVREGRKEEYSSFVRDEGETESTIGGFADPQSEITFVRSKLSWEELSQSPHAEMLRLYRDLLALRRRHACLSNCDKSRTRARFDEARAWLAIERGDEGGSRALLLCNLSDEAQDVPVEFEDGAALKLALWTGSPEYGGAADAERPADSPGETVGLEAWGAALYVGNRTEDNG